MTSMLLDGMVKTLNQRPMVESLEISISGSFTITILVVHAVLG